MSYFDVNPLLAKMLDVAPGISDLNLSVGKPPQVEIEGQLRPVPFAGIEKHKCLFRLRPEDDVDMFELDRGDHALTPLPPAWAA